MTRKNGRWRLAIHTISNSWQWTFGIMHSVTTQSNCVGQFWCILLSFWIIEGKLRMSVCSNVLGYLVYSLLQSIAYLDITTVFLCQILRNRWVRMRLKMLSLSDLLTCDLINLAWIIFSESPNLSKSKLLYRNLAYKVHVQSLDVELEMKN